MAAKRFFEKEIHRVTERLVPIACVWSTYESREEETGPVLLSGLSVVASVRRFPALAEFRHEFLECRYLSQGPQQGVVFVPGVTEPTGIPRAAEPPDRLRRLAELGVRRSGAVSR